MNNSLFGIDPLYIENDIKDKCLEQKLNKLSEQYCKELHEARLKEDIIETLDTISITKSNLIFELLKVIIDQDEKLNTKKDPIMSEIFPNIVLNDKEYEEDINKSLKLCSKYLKNSSKEVLDMVSSLLAIIEQQDDIINEMEQHSYDRHDR